MEKEPVRCLVTGGTGFLGRHLVPCLRAHGCQIRVLTRKPGNAAQALLGKDIEIVQGDIRDEAAVRRAVHGVTRVFHLAAERRNWKELGEVNIEGTRNLLVACSESNTKHVVHMSSVGVFGAVTSNCVTEETPCRPQNEYERTKHAAEQIACELRAERRLPVTVLRPANVFGDRDPERRLLGLMKLLENGRFRFIGSGETALNYVYAGDVALACYLVGIRPNAHEETYILSDPCSLREFVECICAQLGIATPRKRVPVCLAYGASLGAEVASRVLRRPLPLSLGRVQAALSKRVYASDAFRRDYPGWPSTGWKEGVRQTLAWYRDEGLLS